MDRIDRKILEILQENSQINNIELAERVALSPSPCLRRVKLLEESGIIKKQVALLDEAALGLDLTVLVSVGLASHTSKIMTGFEAKIKNIPEVVQCYLMTGQTADYMLKVMVPDLDAFQHFLLKKLTRIDGVTSVHSSFVLQRVCETTALPLEHLL